MSNDACLKLQEIFHISENDAAIFLAAAGGNVDVAIDFAVGGAPPPPLAADSAVPPRLAMSDGSIANLCHGTDYVVDDDESPTVPNCSLVTSEFIPVAFLRRIGNGEGNGADQFCYPRGIGELPNNQVIVCDGNNSRLQVVDYISGNFIKTIGDSESDLNKLSYPTGIGILPCGLAVVCDCHNHRLQVINPADGTFISTIGRGTPGDEDDQFHFPRGMTVLTNGNIVVCDGNNNRLHVINPTASENKFIRRIGNGEGNGPDQFSYPTSVARLLNGHVVVSDGHNHRLAIVEPETGAFIRHIGCEGKGKKQLRYPRGVAVLPSGHVLCCDHTNHKVKIIDPLAGKIIGAIGEGRGNGDQQFEYPSGIAVLRDGTVVVSDRLNHRLQILAISAPRLYHAELISPENCPTDGQGHFSPTRQYATETSRPASKLRYTVVKNAAKHETVEERARRFFADVVLKKRLQSVDGGSQARDAKQEDPEDKITCIRCIGNGPGDGPDQLSYPRGIGVMPDGHVWVADGNNHRIQLINPANGCFLDTIGCEGDGPENFDSPTGVVVLPNGHLAVCDCHNHRLQIINPMERAFVASIGTEGDGRDQFRFPRGMTLLNNGHLVICDGNNNRLQIVDPVTQSFVASVGSDKEFSNPTSISVLKDGCLILTEGSNHRVNVVDPKTWQSIRTIGCEGHGVGQFYQPRGVSVLPNGNAIVADHGNHRLQIIDPHRGEFIKIIGEMKGSEPLQFDSPSGIGLLPNGHVAVSDRLNHRMQIIDVMPDWVCPDVVADVLAFYAIEPDVLCCGILDDVAQYLFIKGDTTVARSYLQTYGALILRQEEYDRQEEANQAEIVVNVRLSSDLVCFPTEDEVST